MQRFLSKPEAKYTITIACVIIMMASLLFGIAVWKYTTNQYNALDVAIFNNVFYRSLRGDFFGSSIHPPTYLADHVSPIILVLLPLYALLPHPLTLIALQIIALMSGAIPLYGIARKKLPRPWAAACAVLWLVNPIIHNIALFEFHLLPFAVVAIMWAAYGSVTERWWLYIISIGVALLVREDVALVTAMFGVIALVEKKSWRWSIPPILLSILYFCIAIAIGSAAGSGSYKFLIYYSWLGTSWHQIIITALTHPWLVAAKIISPGSGLLFAALLLPWCFIPFIRTTWLFLGVLVFIELVTGADWQNLGTVLYTQYGNLLMPGIALAFIESLAIVLTIKQDGLFKKLLARPDVIALSLLTATVYTSATLGPLPGTLCAMTTKSAAPETITKIIPAAARVCASDTLLTALSSRFDVCALTYAWVGVQQFGSQSYTIPSSTEYIAMDTNDLITYQLQYQHNPLYSDAYASSSHHWTSMMANYGVIAADDTQLLWQPHATNTLPLIDIATTTATTTQPIDDNLSFINATTANGTLQLWWHITKPVDTLYRVRVTLFSGTHIIDQRLYPLGYDLLGDRTGTLRTVYYPSFIKKMPPEADRVQLQIITLDKGGLELTSWRSSKIIIGHETPLGKPIDITLSH